MNESKSSIFSYSVEPFEEDFAGRLSWEVLGGRILAAAARHADSHGFGMKQLMPLGMSWVLSRIVINIDEMPLSGGEYSIETWIHGIRHMFTDRCFSILRPGGGLYGYAYSVWALIDMRTRRPVSFSTIPGGGFVDWVDAARPCPEFTFSRIKVSDTAEEKLIRTGYGDIDVNGHVNSIRYIRYALDTLPRNVVRSSSVRRIEVAYHGEAFWGDMLHIRFQREGGDEAKFFLLDMSAADEGHPEHTAATAKITLG